MDTLQMDKSVKKHKLGTRRSKQLTYYCLMLALPILQFCFFWVYVNFSSITMAFNSYKDVPSGYASTFVGFENFEIAFKKLGESTYLISNSMKYFALRIAVGIPLALFFSYYVYKKYFGAGLFRVVLYMPHIISTLVFCLLFKYMVTDLYSAVMLKWTGEKVRGLLDNPDTKLATVLFFNIWIGFGTEVLLYSGTMSGISESIVESAELDGANRVQEFIYITLPMIYPTLTTFIITSIAGIVTNQLNLVSLYGKGAEHLASFGYYLYMEAQNTSLTSSNAFALNYPSLAALGLILTAIIFPATWLTRKLMQKFGPSVD